MNASIWVTNKINSVTTAKGAQEKVAGYKDMAYKSALISGFALGVIGFSYLGLGGTFLLGTLSVATLLSYELYIAAGKAEEVASNPSRFKQHGLQDIMTHCLNETHLLKRVVSFLLPQKS